MFEHDSLLITPAAPQPLQAWPDQEFPLKQLLKVNAKPLGKA